MPSTDGYESTNNREWCEEHGEDPNEMNAVAEGDGDPEDDNLEML